MPHLPPIITHPLNPETPFYHGGKDLGFRIVDFWAWNQSHLVENRNRGVLAEFLVMQALGIKRPTRLEWDEVDLKTVDGIKIEVKSAAYIQAWEQKNYSTIVFDIAPKRKLLPDNNYSEERVRSADFYIFCLLHHKDQETIDPLNLDQWTFYLLSAKTLNVKFKEQKTLSLAALESLGCKGLTYDCLMDTFDKMISGK